MADKIPVELHGAAMTMLTTLYLKALDAGFNRPVLGDGYAKEAVEKIDFDFAGLKAPGRWAPLVTVRTAQYDIWVRQFLAVHPRATVIHLGCGLDSRVFRLNPGPDVQWYDVDQASVIALREKVFPARPGYRLIAASATEPEWLDAIPADRPVLLVAEGISMYLPERDGVALLQRVVDRYAVGELQIDFYNWFGIKSQKTHRLQRQAGSTLHWAVNAPADILDRVSGIRLLAAVTFFDATTFGRTPVGFQRGSLLARAVPPLRRMLQYHRYAFGPAN
ncbi:MAG TPA: class I SAM-dependent methyltransferase [Mycobacterium sp.]|nr:class I SAM-dependent methyltransferase [Mycobacterium sp.]